MEAPVDGQLKGGPTQVVVWVEEPSSVWWVRAIPGDILFIVVIGVCWVAFRWTWAPLVCPRR